MKHTMHENLIQFYNLKLCVTKLLLRELYRNNLLQSYILIKSTNSRWDEFIVCKFPLIYWFYLQSLFNCGLQKYCVKVLFNC